MEWNEMEWNGMEWNVPRALQASISCRNGMEWNGMRGPEGNRMKWNAPSRVAGEYLVLALQPAPAHGNDVGAGTTSWDFAGEHGAAWGRVHNCALPPTVDARAGTVATGALVI